MLERISQKPLGVSVRWCTVGLHASALLYVMLPLCC